LELFSSFSQKGYTFVDTRTTNIYILVRIQSYYLVYAKKVGSDSMKAEDYCKKCPECGSVDKNIDIVKVPRKTEGIPEDVLKKAQESGKLTIIRCSNCRHIFEYAKDSKMDVEFKKICIQ